MRAVAGDPAQLQIMYGLRGERRLSEVELGWLDGYEGAQPVRVGNAAYDQKQLDVFGELATVISEAGLQFDAHRLEAVRALIGVARHVAAVWQLPDRGVWETRGPERSFLPATDPRVVGTVAALERAQLQDGLLLRFKPEREVDGLSGDEGVFLACSFWSGSITCWAERTTPGGCSTE